MIPETRLMALNMGRERVAALREREIAATDLMLLTADSAPPGAPLLAEAGATNHDRVGTICRILLAGDE